MHLFCGRRVRAAMYVMQCRRGRDRPGCLGSHRWWRSGERSKEASMHSWIVIDARASTSSLGIRVDFNIGTWVPYVASRSMVVIRCSDEQICILLSCTIYYLSSEIEGLRAVLCGYARNNSVGNGGGDGSSQAGNTPKIAFYISHLSSRARWSFLFSSSEEWFLSEVLQCTYICG